jgi:hypothetical protein
MTSKPFDPSAPPTGVEDAERAFGQPEYPDRKTHDLTDQEKDQSGNLDSGENTKTLAEEFQCAQTQVAAIKAWTKQ